MLVGLAYMLLRYREDTQSQRDTAAWLRRLNELVDVHDFQDDGHLAEFLEASERRRIIEELERMPSGSRSLRRAIYLVSPELVTDDA